MIPEYLNCKSKEITNCDFYMHTDCKETCNYAQRIQKGIKHRARTGLERFLSRFPSWKFHSQQPEVIACQGGEEFTKKSSDNLGELETGKSNKYSPADNYLGIGAMTEVPGNKYKSH